MRTGTSLLLIAVALAASGCRTLLMKTPAVVANGNVDPFSRVIPERRTNDVPVFVASGRSVSGKTDPAHFYTTDRSRLVRLGRATVEIGPGMSWDVLVRESMAAKRTWNPQLTVTAYEEFGPLWTTAWPPDARFHPDFDAPNVDRAPAERFVAEIDAMLAESRRKQIVLYVHGFNTAFAGNLAIAAEFWHYMSRDGVVISFDWPSKGDLFSYQEDKANADFAMRQCRRLLEFLAAETAADEINIIAHSAGSPVVVEALRQLSLMHYHLDNDAAQRITKIGRVVLAAPDMDLDSAISAAVDGAGRVTQGMTVYA